MTNIVCFNCKYYLGDLKCMAFEDEIPKEILEGKNQHQEPTVNQKTDLVYSEIGVANEQNR